MTTYYTVKRGDTYLAGFQYNGIKDDLGIKYYTCLWSANRKDAKYTETKEIMRDIAQLYDGKVESLNIAG